MFDLLTYALSKKGGGGSADLSAYATKVEVDEKVNGIKTYQTFPDTWNAKATSSYTTKQLCDVINADPTAIEGKTFLGEIYCSDIRGPESGVNLVNGDAVVEIIDGTGISGKVIHINLSSGDTYPYRWEYTYWDNGNKISGWKGFYPVEDSPKFTGVPTAPTAQRGTNTTQIATTAFVQDSLKPTILVNIIDIPVNKTVVLTASLKDSEPVYSESIALDENGLASLDLLYLGEYDISFNAPEVRYKAEVLNVASPKTYIIRGDWSEAVTYTVRIAKSNANTLTACTYEDGALGMEKGSDAWDSRPIFKDIKPCIFKEGQVVYYLDPDDWTKRADGTASDLTGPDGDVMIQFPKFAYKIKTIDNEIVVSISNNPDVINSDSDYTYDAFSRLEEGDLDFFYKGAFKGYIDETGALRSIAGVKPTANKNIGQFRAAAQSNGYHYQQSTYAQLKAIQCLYLIKYGNRNTQSAVGKGVVSASTSYVTGYNTTDVANIESSTNIFASGMNYGTTENSTTHVKLFGIEDAWGSINEWADGLTTDAERNIITSWNSFSGEGVEATTVSTASGLTANSNGYIKDVAGNTDAGFMGTAFSGSSSTYWADYGALYSSCVLSCGGAWGDGDAAGLFYLRAGSGASNASASFGSRLSYV